jgi:hypothetical protein
LGTDEAGGSVGTSGGEVTGGGSSVTGGDAGSGPSPGWQVTVVPGSVGATAGLPDGVTVLSPGLQVEPLTTCSPAAGV